MALLVSEDMLRARAAVASHELSALADGLAAELAPLYERELYIPREKALLSREGGRCPREGTTLEFDPFSPHRHRCPSCGTIYTGVLHDRFWIFWYQLWLAERAVHGAVLAHLRDDARAGALAIAILQRYADEYLRFPNRDNVLGPTRLFFSTYLESIWLLNVSIAMDLLESASPKNSALGGTVRERIIEPSVAIIAEYDEGASNRQVWNDAALIAANRLLDRMERVEDAVLGRSGVVYHLEHGLLKDGTWYEGENYHLFAHRGLWYGLTMTDALGWSLPALPVARFQEGFATPFLTSLPDMTLPSRRDSQYAISLRQPRFAELCELGLAREAGEGDPRLRGVLRRLYEDALAPGDTGRSRTTADVERNLPGTRLSRADLGWRSLLFARPKLPPLDAAPLGTVLLEAQGIAVFRREQERIYVALDYGTSGGGHGHPDRLNVLMSDGSTRWLDDMGTGSYVDVSLQWYRSTLAHNAPLFNGYEQQRVEGELLGFDERGEAGWVSARALDLYPGVATMRTLVVMSDYVLDELVWRSAEPLVMDLPIHLDPESLTIKRSRREREGSRVQTGDGLEDTLGALAEQCADWFGTGSVAQLVARDRDKTLNGFIMPSFGSLLYRATAPGPPGSGRRGMLVLRMSTSGGTHWVRTVWSWTDAVAGLTTDKSGMTAVISRRDGGQERHRVTAGGWRITREAGNLRRTVELRGVAWHRGPAPKSINENHPAAAELRLGVPLVYELGREQYRRSEERWDEAGTPTARVSLVRAPNLLVVDVAVRKLGALTFAPAGAVNPYDNEAPDINGDGVQLYLADKSGASAWMLVPEEESSGDASVRVRVIDGWNAPRAIRAGWQRTGDGYALRARIAFTPSVPLGGELSLGLVVNEKPPDRERRRGQLVLGGASGEFVYLRGDREERDRLPRFLLR